MRMQFPLPFEFQRSVLRGDKNAPYIICAMFTEDYAHKAERLAASCEKFGLPCILYQVPKVHRSISVRGADDLSYTKPNFIYNLLLVHAKPVLYVDADCELASYPELIGRLVESGSDFAIYNWFADDHTDKLVPVSIAGGDGPTGNRFYRVVGGFRAAYSKKQLSCSGCTQFYRNSVPARGLLKRWQYAIAAFPGSADDHCLDFAFNNLSRR